MWRRGGLSWWQLAVRVWRAFWAGQLAGRCAELAYYFLFSVFPLLLFLTTLIGYLAGPDSKLRVLLFRYLDHFSPSAEVTELLRGTLDQVIAGRGGARLSLSLLVALWVASAGMLAVGRTLNSAFEIEETRPWWKRRVGGGGAPRGAGVRRSSAPGTWCAGRWCWCSRCCRSTRSTTSLPTSAPPCGAPGRRP